MDHALKLIITVATLIIVSACGGGSGGGSSGGSSSPSTIFSADTYVNEAVDDSSLEGLWMLVESSTLQFDLDDFTAAEGLFELDYQRRALVVIIELDSTRLVMLHCMDNELLSFDEMQLSGGTLTSSLEGFDFSGSVVSNNRIEAQLSGNLFSGGGAIINSQLTLIKIDDFVNETPRVEPGTVNINIQSATGQINFDDWTAIFFEQVEIEGEGVVDGQLIPISGESIYFYANFDVNEDMSISPEEEVGASILDIRADGIRQRSLTVDYFNNVLSNEESANINISASDNNSLRGTASGDDDFDSSKSGSVTFDIQF